MQILDRKLNVVVVAGASGIGREIALQLAALGANIIINDLPKMSGSKSLKNLINEILHFGVSYLTKSFCWSTVPLKCVYF